MLAAGAQAPSFEALPEMLARGAALIAIYKISCPVCQFTLPFLERIAQGSLQVVAISQDDERATARFRDTYRLTMPSLLDREEAGYPVSNAFGIKRVPSLFLVEPDGAVSLASEGFVKRDLEEIGRRAGVAPFGPGDSVPEWRAG